MGGNVSKRWPSRFIGRWRVAVIVGAALLRSWTAPAAALPSEDELPQGRLGYKWVPDPPSRPLTPQEELGVQVAKYGGGGLVVMWLLRRMFSQE